VQEIRQIGGEFATINVLSGDTQQLCVIHADSTHLEGFADLGMVCAEPNNSMQTAGFGLDDAASVNQVPLRRQESFCDMGIDGIEFHELGDRPGSDSFGLGEQLDSLATGGPDLRDGAPNRCFSW
jgi:hypothetical protein